MFLIDASRRGTSFLALLVLSTTACASHPKMEDGAPLKVRRGYWALGTNFEQRGRQVDNGSVKDVLGKHETSADAVNRAATFDVIARLTAVASGICLGWGLSRTMNHETGGGQSTTTALYLAGAGSLGLSIAFGLGAEGAFISAVDAYNKRAGSPAFRGSEP
jgi:hypothetical protein